MISLATMHIPDTIEAHRYGPQGGLLEEFLRSVRDIGRFASITAEAIDHWATSRPRLLERSNSILLRLQSHTPEGAVQGAAKIEQSKEDAAFLERHRSNGYSTIFSNALVSIWSALESHIDDILLSLVATDKTLLAADLIQKVKIPLALYETMPAGERIAFLIDSIQRDLNSRFKRGVSQFECIFDAFGLSGSLDDDLRRTFMEFSGLRNAIVHRRAIVDKRLIESCPWLGLTIGTELRITIAILNKIMLYSCLYALLVQERIVRRYGQAMPPISDAIAEIRSTILLLES